MRNRPDIHQNFYFIFPQDINKIIDTPFFVSDGEKPHIYPYFVKTSIA
jgi:hypothetical protein